MLVGSNSNSNKPPKSHHGQHVLLLVAITGLLGTFSLLLYGQHQHTQQLGSLRSELEHVRLLLLQQAANATSPAVLHSTELVQRIVQGFKDQAATLSNASNSQPVWPDAASDPNSAAISTGAPSSGNAANESSLAVQQPGQQQQQQKYLPPPGTISLDLVEMLKLRNYFGGITWEPKNCYTGLAELYPSPADWQAIRSRLVADLLLAAGEARGVKPHELDPSQPWWAALKQEQPVLPRSILSDAGFLKWQVLLIQVLSRYLVTFKDRHPAVPCPGMPSDMSITADELPLPGCPGRPDVELIHRTGRHPAPYDALSIIADVVMAPGLCTVSLREGAAAYGDFLMERIMSPHWRTYRANSHEEDAVMFLTDVLYQKNDVHMKQRWLGVRAMQNPFDFLVISDIINAVAPDVIIETGTANGGSSLMWASVLELSGLHDSSVITIDLQPPGSPDAFGADPPEAASTDEVSQPGIPKSPVNRRQRNPTKDPLWAKYVTFIQGSSTDQSVLKQVVVLLHRRQMQLAEGRDWLGNSSLGDSRNRPFAQQQQQQQQQTVAVPLQTVRRSRMLLNDTAPTSSRRLLESAPYTGLPQSSVQSEQHQQFDQTATTNQSSAAVAATGEAFVEHNSGDVSDGISDSAQQPNLSGLQRLITAATVAAAAAPPTAPLQAARRPLRVLVLLDSDHSAKHVYAEMEAYCSLVSSGSYCVVQDTRMSRWSDSDPGPLVAVQSWLQRHTEFWQDRERELFFTHHPQGYLLRVA